MNKLSSCGRIPVQNKLHLKFAFKKILTGSDLSRRRIPFIIADTGVPGPVCWLTACSHGDEVGGIVIIQEIIKKIKTRNYLKKGMVYAFPLMNPIGFETGSRRITFSQEDLNRSFPGNPKGSLGERIAAIIFTTILETAPDLVIDLHTDWIQSIPYALVDPTPSDENTSAWGIARHYALATGFLAIHDSEHVRGALSYTLQKHRIPAFTLELGESYIVNEQNIQYGIRALENVLACLGMIDESGEKRPHPLPENSTGRLLKYAARPYSSTSGIVRFLAQPGDVIKAGKPFAKIYNVFGKLQETMKTETDVIVLGHVDTSVAFPGGPVMAFGEL